MKKVLDKLIRIYDVLKTSFDGNGTPVAQLGNALSGVVKSTDAEYWLPFGLMSMPDAISEDNKQDSPQVLVIDGFDCKKIIGGKYISNQSKYGNAQPGDTILYSGGQARILLKKKNNSIQLYTKNGDNGLGIGINIFPEDDVISVTNSKGYGLRITENGVEILAGDSKIELTPTSIQSLSGGVNQVDGTGVLLGSQAIPGVNAAVQGPLGISGAGSTKVSIEP